MPGRGELFASASWADAGKDCEAVTEERAVSRQAPIGGPPVLLVGGGCNALSVARVLARDGVHVYVINEPAEPVRYSSSCTYLPVAGADRNPDEAWARFLLGPDSEFLRGAVVLAMSDVAIEVIGRHRSVLAGKFLLDISNPDAQAAMLNKRTTYEAARAAGVPTPRFWMCDSWNDVERLRAELVYPLIVKPHHTYQFERLAGAKFVVVEREEQLRPAFERMAGAGISLLLVERIPGPDSQLCSYYTYMDRDGTPLFDYTKRIVRRFPVGMGAGCYHVTDEVPGVRELSLTLFRHVGLRGVANAEFKYDARDGQLKLIECNARFTAGDPLLVASGLPLGAIVYNYLTGRPLPRLGPFTRGLHQWSPRRDFWAYRELRRRGELTTWQWLSSLMCRQVFPYFRWDDPMPALALAAESVRESLSRHCPGWMRRMAPRPHDDAVRARLAAAPAPAAPAPKGSAGRISP